MTWSRPSRAVRPVLLLSLLALTIAAPARAAAPGGLEVVESDASGVTLRFALPAYGVEPIDRLELHIYPGPSQWISGVYDDAGDGWEYENGDFWEAAFEARDDGSELIITCRTAGRRQPPSDAWAVVLHGAGRVAWVAVDGSTVPAVSDGTATRVEAGPFNELVVRRAGAV